MLVRAGMVLDVTQWLPEHPGGSAIIPAQALNLDCARFFEVYHASRESFLYLREFYVGELQPRCDACRPAVVLHETSKPQNAQMKIPSICMLVSGPQSQALSDWIYCLS